MSTDYGSMVRNTRPDWQETVLHPERFDPVTFERKVTVPETGAVTHFEQLPKDEGKIILEALQRELGKARTELGALVGNYTGWRDAKYDGRTRYNWEVEQYADDYVKEIGIVRMKIDRLLAMVANAEKGRYVQQVVP